MPLKTRMNNEKSTKDEGASRKREREKKRNEKFSSIQNQMFVFAQTFKLCGAMVYGFVSAGRAVGTTAPANTYTNVSVFFYLF